METRRETPSPKKQKIKNAAIATAAIVAAVWMVAKSLEPKAPEESQAKPVKILKQPTEDARAGKTGGPKFTTTAPATSPYNLDAGQTEEKETDKPPAEQTGQNTRIPPEETIRAIPGATSTPVPDTGTLGADKEEALREACLDLWDSRTGVPGDAFRAIEKVDELAGIAKPDTFPKYPLKKLAEICEVTTDQITEILKAAANQDDTRAARLLHEHIGIKCLSGELEAQTNASQKTQKDKKACVQLPSGDRSACMKEAIAIINRDRPCLNRATSQERILCTHELVQKEAARCKQMTDGQFGECIDRADASLQQELQALEAGRTACLAKNAQDAGIDLSKVQELDAAGRASELATQRLELFDTQSPPSLEKIHAYVKSVEPIIIGIDIRLLIQKLGLPNEIEFKRQYMDMVVELTKRLYGPREAEIVAAIFKLTWDRRHSLFPAQTQ